MIKQYQLVTGRTDTVLEQEQMTSCLHSPYSSDSVYMLEKNSQIMGLSEKMFICKEKLLYLEGTAGKIIEWG